MNKYLVVVELFDNENEFGIEFDGSYEFFDTYVDAREFAEKEIGLGPVEFVRCYWIGIDYCEFVFTFKKIKNSHGDYTEIRPSNCEEVEDVPF